MVMRIYILYGIIRLSYVATNCGIVVNNINPFKTGPLNTRAVVFIGECMLNQNHLALKGLNDA